MIQSCPQTSFSTSLCRAMRTLRGHPSRVTKPKVKKPLARPPQLLNRSISATQLRHGTLPKQSPQKLVPLATRQPPQPPPPRVGEPERRLFPRHMRVRNQIPQPTENINLSENYKLGGWYEDRSPDRPRFLRLHQSARDRMVIRLPAYDHSSERSCARTPRCREPPMHLRYASQISHEQRKCRLDRAWR